MYFVVFLTLSYYLPMSFASLTCSVLCQHSRVTDLRSHSPSQRTRHYIKLAIGSSTLPRSPSLVMSGTQKLHRHRRRRPTHTDASSSSSDDSSSNDSSSRVSLESGSRAIAAIRALAAQPPAAQPPAAQSPADQPPSPGLHQNCGIIDNLCGFQHDEGKVVKQLFFESIIHHEITFDAHMDMKLLLSSLMGHEQAAKKSLKFILDWTEKAGRRPTLLNNVPPPPRPAVGGVVLRPGHAVGVESDIMALLNKHEGEQRTWAYQILWKQVSGAFPVKLENDIMERFVQLRRHPSARTPAIIRLQGDVQGRPNFDLAETALLAPTIGGLPGDSQETHFRGRALTLSLAEIFLIYVNSVTAKDLYDEWLEKNIVIQHKPRSNIVPAQGEAGGPGKGKGEGKPGSSRPRKRGWIS